MTTPGPPPIAGANLRDVELVSGQNLKVQGDLEVEWFNATKNTYLTETRFTEATDKRDLDRLLTLELLSFRWTQHAAAGVDYEGQLVNEDQLRKQIKEQSDAITKLKQSMGMNKAARDDAANTGNLAEYIQNLKHRAKLFGIHRQNQLSMALTLMNELSAIVGAFDRSDDEERRMLGFETAEDVLDWIRNTMLPEFRQLDEHFRANEQTYWIRSM